MNHIAKQIDELLHPGNGNSVELNSDDKTYISEIEEAVSGLDSNDELAALRFRNEIRGEGRCGFANAGREDYLLNTDSRRRYRVTVRTYWRQGIEHGQYDRAFVSEAGGKKFMGCTRSGSIPVGNYRREVVGEVAI